MQTDRQQEIHREVGNRGGREVRKKYPLRLEDENVFENVGRKIVENVTYISDRIFYVEA